MCECMCTHVANRYTGMCVNVHACVWMYGICVCDFMYVHAYMCSPSSLWTIWSQDRTNALSPQESEVRGKPGRICVTPCEVKLPAHWDTVSTVSGWEINRELPTGPYGSRQHAHWLSFEIFCFTESSHSFHPEFNYVHILFLSRRTGAS